MPRSFLVKKTREEKFRSSDGATTRPCYTPIVEEKVISSRPPSPVSPPSPPSPPPPPSPISPAVVVEPNEIHMGGEPLMPTAISPYPPSPLHPLAVRIANGYIHDVLSTPPSSYYTGGSSGSDGEGAHSPASIHSSSKESDTDSLEDKATRFQSGVTIGYTYDAFFISDGRSRRKNSLGIGIAEPKTRGRYTCNECGKDYATSSNLSRHKQTHRSLDSKQAKHCPHCEKVYVSMPALSMHILTHNLKHQCTYCGKAFSRPWLLQGHMRSHSGEKPYGCAHCGKAFADRSNLRAHMQTHSAFKHFKCKRCNKSFALKSYLNKHYESACFKDDQAPSIVDPMSPYGDSHSRDSMHFEETHARDFDESHHRDFEENHPRDFEESHPRNFEEARARNFEETHARGFL